MHRIAVLATFLGTAGIAVAYALAFASPGVARHGPLVMAIAMPVCLLGALMLGAAPIRRSVGRAAGSSRTTFIAVAATLVLVLVASGFLFALYLPQETVASRLWLGLPLRAAIILYGVGIAPLFILPLVYAVTFAERETDEPPSGDTINGSSETAVS